MNRGARVPALECGVGSLRDVASIGGFGQPGDSLESEHQSHAPLSSQRSCGAHPIYRQRVVAMVVPLAGGVLLIVRGIVNGRPAQKGP